MQKAQTLERPRGRVTHQNDNQPAMEPETRRARIARAAESAAHGPDLGEFAESYRIKPFA